MASKPGATFWLHVMREFVRRVNCHKPEFDTGPALITHVANSLGAAHRVTVLPAAAFYPIDWLTGRGGLNCRSERENATLVEEVVRRVGGERAAAATDDECAKMGDCPFVGTSWAHTWQPWVGTGGCPEPAAGSVGLGDWKVQMEAARRRKAKAEGG